MTNSLNEPDPSNNEPDHGPDSDPRHTGPRRRGRALLTLGAVGVLGVAGGTWWAWTFVNERLSPWVSELLTETLGRPVELGPVERVSPLGLRFGPSAIPPTADDPDAVAIAGINVRFNPFQLLRRQIQPQITLEGVEAYLEQDESGEWLNLSDLDFPEAEPGQDPFIQVNPIVNVPAAEAILLPYSDPDSGAETIAPLIIDDITARVAVTKRYDVDIPDQPGQVTNVQQFDFDLVANPSRRRSPCRPR
jgi:translocation and assembly module TamB